MADVVITTADIQAGTGARTVQGVLGADSLTAGMAVYKDSADSNKLKKCDADDSAKANIAGILLNGGDTDQPCTYLSEGNLDFGTGTLTWGQRYFVAGNTDAGNNAGGIEPSTDLSSGEYVSFIGIATSTSNLLVQPLVSGVALA